MSTKILLNYRVVIVDDSLYLVRKAVSLINKLSSEYFLPVVNL
jgi:hypothetical protein